MKGMPYNTGKRKQKLNKGQSFDQNNFELYLFMC